VKHSDSVNLSVIVPVYNEEEVLLEFHNRLSEVLNAMSVNAKIVYVNDGSTDKTLILLHTLRDNDLRIAILDLSRNFGKEIALTAGLDYASGDAVVIIDADLQDPPELIPELLKHWREGYDVVYAKRIAREGETILKKATARAFYSLIQKVGRVKIPENAGDFRLLSRRAVDALKQIREKHRFMKGLFTWIGYQQKEVPYRRDPRYAGKTKWNYWRLFNFALDAITSFTTTPLKLSTYLGILTAFGAFVYGSVIIFKTLIYGEPVKGYPSLMVVILFLGGIQLVAIGVIGEYLGRMFDESKNRPLYLLKGYEPSDSDKKNIFD
jgi:glycosyltransferase involved in cell wall biosynthesis